MLKLTLVKGIVHLKKIVNLLILKFQSYMDFLLLLNTKEDVLKNVGN